MRVCRCIPVRPRAAECARAGVCQLAPLHEGRRFVEEAAYVRGYDAGSNAWEIERLLPTPTVKACRLRRYVVPGAVLAWLAGGPVLAQTGTAQVDRVIDGDTIRVRLDGARYTVSLTGVDTPETTHPARGVDPYGPEAAAYTTARLTGATVRRDRDPAGDDTDAYGRLLRYVVLANGKNFSATLLHRWLATAIRTFHYARQREFLQLEAQACAARPPRYGTPAVQCYPLYSPSGMSNKTWPPEFSLDQEKILGLLTGDRFYSNPSAALREVILNAIDAVHRHRQVASDVVPAIQVIFSRDDLTLTVTDNGIGMSQTDVSALFAEVGASAATNEAKKDSVGEFGIGVISYFMAGEVFTLQTYDGTTAPIGLSFDRHMLSGRAATEVPPTQHSQGTAISIHLRNTGTFDLLLDSFPHWCRDVAGLSGLLLPDRRPLMQKGAHRLDEPLTLELPEWVERAHLGPVSDPIGWDAMTGISTVAVLYRGVFVQTFEVKGAWGIEGSIDVDPKHFKPRLNREGFVEGQFQEEVAAFLRSCHPAVLEAMVARLAAAVGRGSLNKWTEKRWADLWLSVPRGPTYAKAAQAWDSVFRSLPAFELAVGNQWKPTSLETLKGFRTEVFVAPLAEEQTPDVVRAAVRFLRNTGHTVIRGIRRDRIMDETCQQIVQHDCGFDLRDLRSRASVSYTDRPASGTDNR